MLFAYNCDKQLISVKNSSPDEHYYCPDCGDKLIVKQGTIKIPHFAHRQKINCEGLSEGETQEHLQLKQLFWSSGRSCGEDWQLERPLPKLQQRPDLLYQRTAAEIQCSTLEISRLIQRFDGYRKEGYQDWWLLGPKLWPKKNWSILQKHFCSYNIKNGVHLWLIDTKGLRLLSHIHRSNQHQYYLEQRVPFGSMPLLKVQQISNKEVVGIDFSYQQLQAKRQFLATKLVAYDATIKPLQQFLYQRREHLLHLPHWMYWPSQYSFIYNEAYIIFRYLYWRSPEKPASVMRCFEEFCLSNEINWYFPRIKKEAILQGLLTETRRLILKR